MAINTVYLSTPSGSTTVLSDLSIAGTLDVGVVESAGAVAGSTLSSTQAGGGGILLGSTTSSSVFSTFMSVGELSVVSVSASSAYLGYRSGSTVYLFMNVAASGL